MALAPHAWRLGSQQCAVWGDIYCRPKQLGCVGECQGKDMNAKPETRERGRERWSGCASCHKTWEMPLWLIRVNETIQNKMYRSMGKVKVQKFNRRSERGRVWVEQPCKSCYLCVLSQVVSDTNNTFKVFWYSLINIWKSQNSRSIATYV